MRRSGDLCRIFADRDVTHDVVNYLHGALGLVLFFSLGISSASAETDPDFPPFEAKNKSIGPAERYWLLNRACSFGDDIGVKMLLAAGADPDGAGDYKAFLAIHPFEPSWPINQACWNGHSEVVEILLNAGAKVDHPEGEGFTALIIAAMKNRPQLVKQLLKAGADPEYRGPEGTAREVAKKRSFSEVIKLLPPPRK